MTCCAMAMTDEEERDFLRRAEINWVLNTFPDGGPRYEDWMAKVVKARGQEAADKLRAEVRKAYAERNDRQGSLL